MTENQPAIWVRQEVKAALAFAALGVIVDTEPETIPADSIGCHGCTWHALDAEGEQLDGGSLSTLLDWTTEGYISPVTVKAVQRSA